jgi:Domain of unknown function (DUF4402)
MKYSALLLATSPLFVSSMVFGQSSAQASTTASAYIYVPITLTKVNDLSFGDVFPGSSAGTVHVNAADNSTSSAPVASGITLAATHPPSAAQFTLTGKKSAKFNVTLPTSVAMASGGNSITVDTWTVSVGNAAEMAVTGASGTKLSTTLPSGATGPLSTTLGLGATMHLAANQAEGDYLSPGFNVTVAYE